MYSTTFYDGADKICEVKHEKNTFEDILSKLTEIEYTKVVEAFVDYYNFGVNSSDEELTIEEIENAEMLAEMIDDLNYADGDFYTTVKLDDEEITTEEPIFKDVKDSMEMVKFFNPKTKEVFAEVESDDEWQVILKRLTEDELAQLRRWFVFLVCLHAPDDEEPWLDSSDLTNLDEFTNYLCDYSFDKELYEFYEKESTEKVKVLTIRDLYAIGKKNNILDKPLTWNFYDGDYYYPENTTADLTENDINYSEFGMFFSLEIR